MHQHSKVKKSNSAFFLFVMFVVCPPCKHPSLSCMCGKCESLFTQKTLCLGLYNVKYKTIITKRNDLPFQFSGFNEDLRYSVAGPSVL